MERTFISQSKRPIFLCSVLALASGGEAQYFTPSFQNYQTYAQRSVGYVAATVRPESRPLPPLLKLRIVRLTEIQPV